MTKKPKQSSHFKAGMVAGALFGLAAGIYMSSKEGKQMAKRLQSESAKVHKKLMTELKKKKELSEKAYEESIDTVLAYYLKSSQIAKTELPALRRYLLGKWQLVQKEMRDVKPRSARKGR